MAKGANILMTLSWKRFRRDQKGIASVEFALMVPLTITLFFGILEFSDAMSANRKVNYAATMLVDLVSQEQFLSEDDISGIYTAVDQVLEPYGIVNPTMWVTSVTIDSNDKPIIDWSLKDDMSEPFPRGAEFNALSDDDISLWGDDALIDEGSSLIIGYIEYSYTSTLSSVMVDQLTFKNHATRWPRRTSQIIYCNSENECSDD